MKIDSIDLKIIPDSKGQDTLEAKVESEGTAVVSSVPTGESTGKYEAKLVEPKIALEKVNWVFSQIKDHQFFSLEQFDGLLNTLDGTADKSRLGANLILSLSLSFTKLFAKQNKMETWEFISKISGSKSSLPLCLFNVIEGGVHAKGSLPFQEHWFIPKTRSPEQSLTDVSDLLQNLEVEIKQKFGEIKTGSEGGYTIPSQDPEDGLKILDKLIKQKKYDANLGLDCAASSFYKSGQYLLGDKKMDKDKLLAYYQLLTTSYPLVAIEDPFAEDDWEGFTQITKDVGDKVWVVADDLTTTNPAIIKKAAQKGAANAVIIKPTQIGTVTETIQAANLAKIYGWKIVVSNRGHETLDTFIADLAVGLGADAIKSGCPLQKERMVKYKRLVEIEKSLKCKV